MFSTQLASFIPMGPLVLKQFFYFYMCEYVSTQSHFSNCQKFQQSHWVACCSCSVLSSKATQCLRGIKWGKKRKEKNPKVKIQCWEFQLWLSGNELVSMRMQVRSLALLSGLRIWCCCAVVQVADVARIWYHCGVGQQLQLQLQCDPQPGNFHKPWVQP